jgi:quercetin dioxygenase-like cupin family protein
MHPVILHVPGSGSRKQPDSHDGERFLLVLEGDVRVTYGDEHIQLATGDSIYLHAAIPHTITAAGRGGARVLSVAYDPASTDAPPARRGRRAVPANGSTAKASRGTR